MNRARWSEKGLKNMNVRDGSKKQEEREKVHVDDQPKNPEGIEGTKVVRRQT